MSMTVIKNGSRQVIINEHSQWSRNDSDHTYWVSARLYVNNGETACHQNWKGKTVKGAQKWAIRVLA